MARIVDISEKLSWQGNPRLDLGGLEVEVRSDAETVLKILGLVADGLDNSSMAKAMALLFSEADLKRMMTLTRNGVKLSFSDYQRILTDAFALATEDGGGDPQGEAESHTTT